MISKFDSLYAGHVDMEDVGYGGTAVNDRWFSDEHLATAADKATAMARLMDGLGYDTLWLAEHHFQREGFECIPNIMMLGVHLAHLTKELKIGCGFNVTPMWHPLRLAEDFATVDYLTGGAADIRRGKRIPLAGGGNVRCAGDGPGSEQGAIRRAGGDNL